MATDKSIQQVINELNYEIIQLKYKNETNVTMRIDAIIEYLEGIKDDVIKIQSNQKFDLHRTATNCTITILDEDDQPITDGSNKLSFGDVIKISAVASTNYENPTIKVNGVSFTSGNTMVVKTDLTIVGVATGVPYDLSRTATNCTITVLDSDNEPITDGEDKIKYGDTIKISAVASEGYDNATLTVNSASFTSGNTMTVTGDVVIVGSATEISTMTPFAVSDVLASGDKIIFDTTKGTELTTFLRSLDFSENNSLIEEGILPLMKGEGAGGSGEWILGVLPTQTENNDALLFLNNLEGVHNVIYSTFAMSDPDNPNSSEAVVEGWNNGIGETGYITLNETEGATGYIADNALPITITTIVYPTSWNGSIIGKE